MSDNDKNLFDGLSDFGFDNLEELSLYQSIEAKQQESKKPIELSYTDAIFDRKVDCPACDKKILVPAIKSVAIKLLSRDTDFLSYYKDPNPMFYDVWLCKNCGYAAMSNRFKKLSNGQKILINQKISAKWKLNKEYPKLYTVDIAIEMYQLALLSAVVKSASDSEKALVCLKLGWLYRLKKDENNEKKYLTKAIQGFINCVDKEQYPIGGLDKASLEYLMGELYRRTGDKSNALFWYGRALVNNNAKSKIKEMAREQKHSI